MRKVNRGTEPPSLRKNKIAWCKALLDKIKECRGTRGKVPDSFYDKYQKEDVKKELKRMYKELCCYCEGTIGEVEFGHIEHRKPKRKYPRLTFNWDNLHLSCTACNQNKGNHYDETNPILDAANDHALDHLTYKCDEQGVWRDYKTLRGLTTIKHTDLNREALRKSRSKVLLKAFQMVMEIKAKPTAPGVEVVKQRLKALCQEEYGSVAAHVMGGLI